MLYLIALKLKEKRNNPINPVYLLILITMMSL